MDLLADSHSGKSTVSNISRRNSWQTLDLTSSQQGGASAIIAVIFLRESYAYVLLDRKTKRLRKETGNPNLRSVLDTGRNPKDFFKMSIVRPIRMLCLSPIVLIVSVILAVVSTHMFLGIRSHTHQSRCTLTSIFSSPHSLASLLANMVLPTGTLA